MTEAISESGLLEVRLSEDKTVALATVRPPAEGQDAVTVTEARELLKHIGVTYGIRDHAIRDAIHYAADNRMPAINAVVAQGTAPEHGVDAHVQFRLPHHLLTVPPPRHANGPAFPDWFALDPAKLVTAGQELATVVPPRQGSPGRTLTWPIQSVPPNPAKPADIRAGENVAIIEGTRLVAAIEGYACLYGDTLTVHALRVLDDDIRGDYSAVAGLVIMGNAVRANVRSRGFVAVKGTAVAARLRADDDVLVSHAENCDISTAGSIYVLRSLKNCNVTTRGGLILHDGATLCGGVVKANLGVEGHDLGSSNGSALSLLVGTDHFSELRLHEIQEELAACEENISRISRALRPFTTHSSNISLSDDKRSLLHKLQLQKRNLDILINALHTERRNLSLLKNERAAGAVSASGTVWPGVRIEIAGAAVQIERAVMNVRFTVTAGGKSVEVTSNLETAA